MRVTAGRNTNKGYQHNEHVTAITFKDARDNSAVQHCKPIATSQGLTRVESAES